MPGQVGVAGSSGSSGGITSLTFETPTGDVDGVNDDFVFTAAPIFVTYQGIIQDLTADYTVVGSTVTFVVPPAGVAGDVFKRPLRNLLNLVGNSGDAVIYSPNREDCENRVEDHLFNKIRFVSHLPVLPF